LIFGKIITIVATRDGIFRLKRTKFYFDWGSTPYHAGGAYSAHPDPYIVEFKGTYFQKEGGKGRRRKAKRGKRGLG